MFRKFITIFLLFTLTIAAVTYLLPSEYQFSKRIETLYDSKLVSDYIYNLNNWQQWAPWVYDGEFPAENSFEGIPGTVNHRWDWRSETKGTGSAIITSIDSAEGELQLEVFYASPVALRSTYTIQVEPLGSGSAVVLKSEGHLSYPLGRLFGFFLQHALDKEMGGAMDLLKKNLDERESKEGELTRKDEETFVEY